MRDIIIGKLVEESKDIRSASFKVYIPKLMCTTEEGAPVEEDVKISDDIFVVKRKCKVVKRLNYIEVKSATDYASKFEHAIIDEMQSSEGITADTSEPFACNKGGNHPPHTHPITDPITLTDFTLHDINVYTVNKGEDLMLVRVGVSDFRCIHIPNKIPQL